MSLENELCQDHSMFAIVSVPGKQWKILWATPAECSTVSQLTRIGRQGVHAQ